MSKISVGSLVVLNPTSQFADRTGKDICNPLNVVGTVTELDEKDLQAGGLGVLVEWSNTCTNFYSLQDLILTKQRKKVPTVKKPNVPKVREKTFVYFGYRDGTKYEQRRAKNVVIHGENKAVHVDSERNLGDGLVVRQNSTIPFKLLAFVDVHTSDAKFRYYFSEGNLTNVSREFNRDMPFKTQTH